MDDSYKIIFIRTGIVLAFSVAQGKDFKVLGLRILISFDFLKVST